MPPPQCAYCHRPFPPNTQAPHKRFCSAEHRRLWHLAERREALAERRAKWDREIALTKEVP